MPETLFPQEKLKKPPLPPSENYRDITHFDDDELPFQTKPPGDHQDKANAAQALDSLENPMDRNADHEIEIEPQEEAA